MPLKLSFSILNYVEKIDLIYFNETILDFQNTHSEKTEKKKIYLVINLPKAKFLILLLLFKNNLLCIYFSIPKTILKLSLFFCSRLVESNENSGCFIKERFKS